MVIWGVGMLVVLFSEWVLKSCATLGNGEHYDELHIRGTGELQEVESGADLFLKGLKGLGVFL